MEPYPTLRTERLVLREFTLEDAPELHRLAQAREVARMMSRHPHPYEEGTAVKWIKGLRPMFDAGIGTTFAVVLREGGALIGRVSLYTRAPDGTAVLGEEGTGLLGFWLGMPYWSKGYATEAVAEVVRYGFTECSLLRIRANHFGSNTASGRVLRKVGMSHVGTRPNYYEKWGNAEDREEYVLLARNWRATEGRSPSYFRKLRYGELRRIPLPRTGVKIALATAPFSWLRGGSARAMDHFGE
jgi:[ribosomal protein S5]-alanine N-acetyltransferase